MWCGISGLTTFRSCVTGWRRYQRRSRPSAGAASCPASRTSASSTCAMPRARLRMSSCRGSLRASSGARRSSGRRRWSSTTTPRTSRYVSSTRERVSPIRRPSANTSSAIAPATSSRRGSRPRSPFRWSSRTSARPSEANTSSCPPPRSASTSFERWRQSTARCSTAADPLRSERSTMRPSVRPSGAESPRSSRGHQSPRPGTSVRRFSAVGLPG